jgi:hypothetical protein
MVDASVALDARGAAAKPVTVRADEDVSLLDEPTSDGVKNARLVFAIPMALMSGWYWCVGVASFYATS